MSLPDFTNSAVLKLRIHTQSSALEIAVNGVVIFTHVKGRQVTTEWPLNEWLHRGDNSVRLVVSKPISRDARDPHVIPPSWDTASKVGISLCSKTPGSEELISHWGVFWRFGDMIVADDNLLHNGVSLDESVFDEEHFDRAAITRNWPDDEESKIATETTGNADQVRISRKFTLPVSWPLCDWGDAIPLDDSPPCRHSLNVMYNDIWNALSGGHVEQLRRMMEFRANSYARAYFLKDRHEVDEALQIIPAVAGGLWRMKPLDLEDTDILLHPNKKIAELRTKSGNLPPIQFTTNGGMSGGIEVALSCIAGRWTWIR